MDTIIVSDRLIMTYRCNVTIDSWSYNRSTIRDWRLRYDYNVYYGVSGTKPDTNKIDKALTLKSAQHRLHLIGMHRDRGYDRTFRRGYRENLGNPGEPIVPPITSIVTFTR